MSVTVRPTAATQTQGSWNSVYNAYNANANDYAWLTRSDVNGELRVHTWTSNVRPSTLYAKWFATVGSSGDAYLDYSVDSGSNWTNLDHATVGSNGDGYYSVSVVGYPLQVLQVRCRIVGGQADVLILDLFDVYVSGEPFVCPQGVIIA